MRLALFDNLRLGAVDPHHGTVADVTHALPYPHTADHLGAGWWRQLCRDYTDLLPRLETAARRADPLRLSQVRLRAPVLNPGKIIACASNYADHVAEIRDHVMARQVRNGGTWLLNFDVFLKAPTSISGPADPVVLPAGPLEAGHPIHHESELTLVIGRGGKDVDEASALSHVFGYTIGLDMTERGDGDRSRRKSYDTFTPLGPWITTAEEVPDPHALDIELRVDGKVRQKVTTSDMITTIPQIIAEASRAMRLEPGDLIMTGAPPGVGPVSHGNTIDVAISRLGRMNLPVRAASTHI
jgi:2-keto-4-pentenoate hydratase/2-oxohepta-3-ene-1,7-dioic acid hydratase in catechol pathway